MKGDWLTLIYFSFIGDILPKYFITKTFIVAVRGYLQHLYFEPETIKISFYENQIAQIQRLYLLRIFLVY